MRWKDESRWEKGQKKHVTYSYWDDGYTAVEGDWLWGKGTRKKKKKHKTETVTFFNSAPKACVCAKACAYVGASGNPPSVVEYVHIAVCVFALSVWAACVRLSVNLFPAQSVCQSVIFCLLDKEIERMCVCVCVCVCVCAHRANSFKPRWWQAGIAVFL